VSPYWICVSLFFLSLGITSALKGKYILAAVGLLVPFWVWPIAAVRLAKPSSLWAAWFYDERKMRRAAVRFGEEEAPELDLGSARSLLRLPSVSSRIRHP
jgi:hypothetical protein